MNDNLHSARKCVRVCLGHPGWGGWGAAPKGIILLTVLVRKSETGMDSRYLDKWEFSVTILCVPNDFLERYIESLR